MNSDDSPNKFAKNFLIYLQFFCKIRKLNENCECEEKASAIRKICFLFAGWYSN